MELHANDPNICSVSGIKFNGSINEGDSETFAFFLKKLYAKYGETTCRGAANVYIDSNGGSVEEALRIGEIIRSNEMTIWIGPNGKCFSSCVFLLAAGINRLIFGSVGIHRPFYTKLDANTPISEVRRQREILNERIRNYLIRMDVSPKLLEDSLGVEPEKIKILTENERMMYRIEGRDAAYDELITARMAEFYEMPMAEYRTKNQQAISKCNTKENFSVPYAMTNCLDSEMLGISTTEAERRRVKIISQCSGKEKKGYLECRKNILLRGK